MDKFPTLPEHYIKRIVGDMLPDDIYYLKSETLCVDRQTLQPYFNKYTPITPYDAEPQRLVGRYGLMRVFSEDPSNSVDGYVIDMRFIDHYEVEQDDVTPPADASLAVIEELESERKDLLSPLAILVNDENMSKEIFLGPESLYPYLLHLCERSDEIHERIALRSSKRDKLSPKARDHKRITQNNTSKPQ